MFSRSEGRVGRKSWFCRAEKTPWPTFLTRFRAFVLWAVKKGFAAYNPFENFTIGYCYLEIHPWKAKYLQLVQQYNELQQEMQKLTAQKPAKKMR